MRKIYYMLSLLISIFTFTGCYNHGYYYGHPYYYNSYPVVYQYVPVSPVVQAP